MPCILVSLTTRFWLVCCTLTNILLSLFFCSRFLAPPWLKTTVSRRSMQYGGRKNGRLEKGSAASTGLAHSSRSQGARQNREVEFTAQILSQDISNHTSYLTMQNINLDMILFKHRFSMSLLSNVISSRRRQGATLPQAQIKGKTHFPLWQGFCAGMPQAWLCQISEEKIGQYAAQRAYARGSNMLCEFSAIVTDLQLLPVLGFPEIRGMHDMPISLFESSIELASELLTLLTTCMDPLCVGQHVVVRFDAALLRKTASSRVGIRNAPSLQADLDISRTVGRDAVSSEAGFCDGV